MRMDTCAVIVTFSPDVEFLYQQIDILKKQCVVVVVDNSEELPIKKEISDLCEETKTYFLDMEDNAGIGAAQNFAITFVKEKVQGCQYILLLDHDSIPSNKIVFTLYSEYKEINRTNKTAVIGPSLYDPRANQYHGFHVISSYLYKRIKSVEVNEEPVECVGINSSGSFFSIEVFDDVGPFDEGFFIDHVETDWCLRAVNAGYKLYATQKDELIHFMGDDVLIFNVFGKRKFMPYRSPLRHRYLFRNSVALLKRSYTPFIWKFYCLVKLLYTFLIFTVFSNEKLPQARAMILGLKDGILGNDGKI